VQQNALSTAEPTPKMQRKKRMSTSLAEKKCTPCEKGATPLDQQALRELGKDVAEWNIIDVDTEPKLRRTFSFKNFADALTFVNKIGALAEEQDHHPDIQFGWGEATIVWWSHKIKGLHENDFILASRSDQLYNQMSGE